MEKKDGFKVAFALTAYDGDSSVIEDPKLAMVQPYIRSWGIPENEGGKIIDRPLEWHQCSPEELGLTESSLSREDVFFPIMRKSKLDLETYGSKMKCIDYDDFEIFGNFNSQAAKQLTLYLELCDQSTGLCESEDKVNDWLKDKYLLVLSNQINFDSEAYDQDKIRAESTLTWYKVNTQMRESMINSIEFTHLEL
jgi:hypothetical protein